jgi:hypothetical protein
LKIPAVIINLVPSVAKIDLIDKRLDDLGRLFHSTAVSDDRRQRRLSEETVPFVQARSNESTCSPHGTDNNLPVPDGTRERRSGYLDAAKRHIPTTPSSRSALSTPYSTGDETVIEGPSSMSAQSTQAIDFLNRHAEVDRGRGLSFQTHELLESLREIVVATKTHAQHGSDIFSSARPPSSSPSLASTMVPIQIAAAVMKGAQGTLFSIFYAQGRT